MEDSKKKKEAELMKKFADMKEKYQQESSEGEQSEENRGNGVIPERNFKKNLGCGG